MVIREYGPKTCGEQTLRVSKMISDLRSVSSATSCNEIYAEGATVSWTRGTSSPISPQTSIENTRERKNRVKCFTSSSTLQTLSRCPSCDRACLVYNWSQVVSWVDQPKPWYSSASCFCQDWNHQAISINHQRHQCLLAWPWTRAGLRYRYISTMNTLRMVSDRYTAVRS